MIYGVQKFFWLSESEVKEMAEKVMAQEAQRHLEEEKKRLEEKRQEAKIHAIIMIVAGNLILGLLAALGWFLFRKFKKGKKETEEAFSISMPPPPSA